MPDAGDVVVARFPGVTGTKRRPAVILSSDAYHSARPDVIIGLLTSQTAGAIAPTDYQVVDWAAANLRVPTAFRAFIVTIPASDVVANIGRLSDADWSAIKDRVRLALTDLEPTPD